MPVEIDKKKLPSHVAIIMDGNGRWAKKRGFPRIMGHKQGVNATREVVRAARELGIKVLTLYAFSLENWKRPKDEVDALMRLLAEHLKKELSELVDNGIFLKIIGETDRLPKKVQNLLKEAMEKTSHNRDMILNMALSYGSRSEIARATRQIAEKCLAGDMKPSDINEKTISRHLYTADLPDPDLIIRTSGEMRLSNFLLFQAAYSELHIVPTLWPDFDRECFLQAISHYQNRERRFGQTGDQISKFS